MDWNGMFRSQTNYWTDCEMNNVWVSFAKERAFPLISLRRNLKDTTPPRKPGQIADEYVAYMNAISSYGVLPFPKATN